MNVAKSACFNCIYPALRHKELSDLHCCCEHVVWQMAACHNVSTARCDRNCCLWVKRNNDGGNIRSNYYWYRHSRNLPASSRTMSDPYVGAFPVQCRLWRASVICLPHTFASLVEIFTTLTQPKRPFKIKILLKSTLVQPFTIHWITVWSSICVVWLSDAVFSQCVGYLAFVSIDL